MPTNKTRKLRTRGSINLDETILKFLLTGEKPERDTPAWGLYISRHFDGGEQIRAAREQLKIVK